MDRMERWVYAGIGRRVLFLVCTDQHGLRDGINSMLGDHGLGDGIMLSVHGSVGGLS